MLAKEEILSPIDAGLIYQQLADYHLKILKRQSKCEFFYWKSLGVFFFLSFLFLILKNYGFTFSPYLGITLVSIGTFLMLIQNIRQDLEYGIQAASSVKQGLSIENKIANSPHIFQIYEENKHLTYKGHLISRLFPMGFIILGTTIAGVIFSFNISLWFAVSVGLISIITIYVGTRLYLKVIRKIIFSS